MNSSSFTPLAIRRAELIARCTAQRDALSMQNQGLAQMLSTLDHGLSVLRRIKNSPATLVGLLVGLAIIKPRRLLPVVRTGLLPLLRTGLLAWQALRTVAPMLHDRVARNKKKSGV